MWVRWVMFGAAAILGACTNFPIKGFNDYVLTQTVVQPSYDPGNFRLAHGGKDMPVVVHGQTLGQTPAQIGAAIAGAMTGHTPAGPTTFKSQQQAGGKESRLAVKIDPVLSMSAIDLCEGRKLESRLKSAPEEVRMIIAYCNGDRRLSSTHLSLNLGDDPRGVNAVAFRKAMAVVALRLFPARDPNDDPDRRPFLNN